MIYIWCLFLFIAFCFGCRKTIYVCQFLLISRILIPETVRMTPLFDISLNTMFIGFLGLFLFRDFILGRTKISSLLKNAYSKKIILYAICFLCIFFFASVKNFNFQLSKLIQFCITDFIPVIIFALTLKTKKDLELTLKTLLICSFISCLWGCLTLIIGSNPYVGMMNLYYGYRADIMSYNPSDLGTRGGVLSTSGTFVSSNGWGYFLPIAFVLVFFYNTIKKSRKNVILMILLSIAILICAKRTALAAYLGFWILYFLMNKNKRKYKFILYGSFAFLIFLIFVYSFPELGSARKLIESTIFFWNDNLSIKNDVGGSSWEMRLNQMTYCFVEVKNNLLFGNGFGWTAFYLSTHVFHPILFGFENIISDAVCNGGITGLLLWIYIFVSSYKYSSELDKDKKYYIIFTLVQLMIALGSGLSYFIFYGLFIVILHKFYLLKSDEKNISSNGHI